MMRSKHWIWGVGAVTIALAMLLSVACGGDGNDVVAPTDEEIEESLEDAADEIEEALEELDETVEEGPSVQISLSGDIEGDFEISGLADIKCRVLFNPSLGTDIFLLVLEENPANLASITIALPGAVPGEAKSETYTGEVEITIINADFESTTSAGDVDVQLDLAEPEDDFLTGDQKQDAEFSLSGEYSGEAGSGQIEVSGDCVLVFSEENLAN